MIARRTQRRSPATPSRAALRHPPNSVLHGTDLALQERSSRNQPAFDHRNSVVASQRQLKYGHDNMHYPHSKTSPGLHPRQCGYTAMRLRGNAVARERHCLAAAPTATTAKKYGNLTHGNAFAREHQLSCHSPTGDYRQKILPTSPTAMQLRVSANCHAAAPTATTPTPTYV